MARFFKPLLGAVALAAATLTSTGAFAAYAYNAQITVTAPKGSTAEAAAKDKTKPTGVKFSSCAAPITAVTPNILNPDFLQFTIKYDAGKDSSEIGDVYLVLQDLSVNSLGTPAAGGPDYTSTTGGTRYLVIGRNTSSGFGNGTIAVKPGAKLADLTTATTFPFVSKSNNLGTGAQTEVLLGGAINMTGLNKGLWAATVIIAKPGASGVTTSIAGTDQTTAASAVATATSSNTFYFGRPETWAAHDTVVFTLGSPIAISADSLLTDVDAADPAGGGKYFPSQSTACQ